MKNQDFMVGYMSKSAELTWDDLQTYFNRATINPLVRTALFGGAGYFGSKYLFNKITDKMATNQLASQNLSPEQQQIYWEEFKRRQQGAASAVGLGGAALAGFLPFSQTLGDYSRLPANASFSDYMAPLFKTQEEKKAFISSSETTGMPNPYVSNLNITESAERRSAAPYKDSSSDLALGTDFVMPAFRPLEFAGHPDIPVASSMDLMRTQAPILGEPLTDRFVQGIDNSTAGKSGLVTTLELAQGLSRAGFGAVGGLIFGNILGTIFSQDPAVKGKLARYGAIGGAILNSGVLRRLPFV